MFCELKDYTTAALREELARRGKRVQTVEAPFRRNEIETAAHYVRHGDAHEAAVWIARAHPDLDGLAQLIARTLPTAGV